MSLLNVKSNTTGNRFSEIYCVAFSIITDKYHEDTTRAPKRSERSTFVSFFFTCHRRLLGNCLRITWPRSRLVCLTLLSPFVGHVFLQIIISRIKVKEILCLKKPKSETSLLFSVRCSTRIVVSPNSIHL